MGIISRHRHPFGDDFIEVNPTGDPTSDLWFIGEAPGRQEHEEQYDCDRGIDCRRGRCTGHVFCGPTGQTFDVWLEKAGLDRASSYVTNTVAIWPGAADPDAVGAGSAKPTQEMVDYYRPRLLADLKRYNPKWVVGLGAYAYRTLLHGSSYAHLGMEKIGGRPCVVRDRVIFPVTHPSAGLHSPFDAVQTWLGLRSVSDYYHGRLVIPKPITKRYRVLRGYDQVKAVLVAIPKRKRAIGIGVDTEGYKGYGGQPDDWWSLQFETGDGVAYLIYANDTEGIRAFNEYAPRPFIMHNGMHDLDPIEALGIECGDGDWEDTIIKTYICAKEPAKGDADSDEASVYGQGLKIISFKYHFEEMQEFKVLIREPQANIVSEYLDKVWGSLLGPSEPEVVNKYQTKPQSNDVSIMRPGPWGNPFPIVKANKKKGVKGQSRTQALKKYKEWIVKQPKLLARLHELIDKRLVCCCKPAKCHGDILAKMVAALPGKLDIPREGKGQTPARRILGMIHDTDNVVKRWSKLQKDKPHWAAKIRDFHGPTPRLTLKHLPKKEFIEYACADPDMTARNDRRLTAEMNRLGIWQPYWIDMGIVPMLRSMEGRGLRVDRDRLAGLQYDVENEHKRLRAQLVDIGAQFDMPEFSPDSNDDIAVLLYERMRVKHKGRKTPSGSRLSVEEKVLMSLPIEEGDRAFAFRKLLLDYKEVFTLLTRYILPLPNFIYPDGRIHPEWRHTVTVSGRLACGGKPKGRGHLGSPNLLAFPSRSEFGKRVRYCFVPADGYVILSADLSQIELRVLASESRDPVMMRAFLEGRDMHADAAESAFKIFKDKVSPELWELKRTQAKELNFGAAYGLTGSGYQMRLAMKDVFLSLKECEAAIAAKRVEWKVAFDFLAAAGDELAASPDAIVRDMWDRIRYLPMIWSPVERAQAEARRQAGNMKIQGGAQGVEKLGMRAWWDQREEMPDCHPLLQIHDDVVFEVKEEHAAEYGKKIQHIFSDAAQSYFSVPILTGVKYGWSWGEMDQKVA